MQQRQVDAGRCNVVVVAPSDSHHRGAYVICSWLISQLAAGLLQLAIDQSWRQASMVLSCLGYLCKSLSLTPICLAGCLCMSCLSYGHSSVFAGIVHFLAGVGPWITLLHAVCASPSGGGP